MPDGEYLSAVRASSRLKRNAARPVLRVNHFRAGALTPLHGQHFQGVRVIVTPD